tara:strand:+ start:1197 stop:2018 length:822 start_codon:yes stop_codon:yes gene_type:complete
MILNFLYFIDESYLRGISKLKPSFFCFLFNLRQLLTFRKSTIFHFSKKQNLFYAKEKGLTIYFFSPYRQARLYSRGIKNRLKNLSSDYFLNSIPIEDNDYIIDCGANIGEFYISLSKFSNKKINYIGFEPSPKEFECLSINASTQKYEKIALSNSSKKQKFYISSEEADNSLVEPKNFSNFIDIKTKRLDKILSNTPIKLLKIDAEGAEIELLEGCEGILNNIKFISIDLGPERGLDSVPTFREVIPFLINKGFVIEKISQKRYTFLFVNPDF